MHANPSSQNSSLSSWHSPLRQTSSQLTAAHGTCDETQNVSALACYKLKEKEIPIQNPFKNSPEHPVLKIRLSLLLSSHPRLASDQLNRLNNQRATARHFRSASQHLDHTNAVTLTTHPAHRHLLSGPQRQAVAACRAPPFDSLSARIVTIPSFSSLLSQRL